MLADAGVLFECDNLVVAAPRNMRKQCDNVLLKRGDFKMVLKQNCSMFPEWYHAVPESAYFKVPETLKTLALT